MNDKILLVNLSLAKVSTTPFFVMPAGLLAVAAYLQKNGFEVEIIDFNVIKKTFPDCTDETLLTEFSGRLIKSSPSLVGFSTMVAGQFKLADDASKIVKKLYPDVPTVVGGAHVSQFPKEILSNCSDIDFVVIGEGEKQALALARLSRSGTLPENDLDGIAYRSNGRIVVKLKLSFMPNVNELPFPSYDLLNFNEYLHDTSTWHNPYNVDFGVRVPIITSRGCPNVCTFCSVAISMGSSYRPMKAIKVADLIE